MYGTETIIDGWTETDIFGWTDIDTGRLMFSAGDILTGGDLLMLQDSAFG